MADIHVMPVDDLCEHVEARECWCQPRIEGEDKYGVSVVIHHSMDGRELIEQHGIQ